MFVESFTWKLKLLVKKVMARIGLIVPAGDAMKSKIKLTDL